MFDRFSSVRDVLIRLCLGVFVFFISACGTTPAGAISSYLSACQSTVQSRNPFFSHQLSPYTVNIFAAYKSGSASARQEALIHLGKNMDLWSDYRNVVSDDGQIVRIVITYLDPVLVQYIILNNVLSLPREVSNGIDINVRLQNEMTELGRHDKLLFVVAITSSTTNVQAYNEQALHLEIPIDNLILIHPSGQKTKPSYIDNILTQKIDVAQGPIHGIVGYPVSVMVQENCMGFLGDWTSSLTLDLDASLSLGEKRIDSLFWSIPFQPLMLQDENHFVPAYDQSYDSRLVKLENPPLPDLRTKSGLDETTARYYWEDMGRYLWNVLIGESGH